MATYSAPCVVCGSFTEWACSDCKIDTGKSVHVCNTKECQLSHEAKLHPAKASAESATGSGPDMNENRLHKDFLP